MNFRKFTFKVTLAIAVTLGLQSASHAAPYKAIANHMSPQTVQPQRVYLAQSELPQAPASITNLEGQTFFSHPPQLLQAVSSEISPSIPATYKFTLTVPEDAGQQLKAVTIAQVENLEIVRFDITTSQAFSGDRVAVGTEIPLVSLGNEQPTNLGEATIVFAEPVQPGSTITIALAVQRNPRWGGVYEFGVTAYPEGKNGLGQFLGYGRISFYENSN